MGKLSDWLGSTVYLDSNIVIYAVEGFPEYAIPIKALLEAMDAGDITSVTSDLTLAEVLVKPKEDQNEALCNAYRRFLGGLAVPISRQILETAAEIRSSGKLRLPDAIHLATALSSNCDSFLTNDQAFKTVTLIDVHLVSDVVLP